MSTKNDRQRSTGGRRHGGGRTRHRAGLQAALVAAVLGATFVAVPVAASLEGCGLLPSCVGARIESWPLLHSSWFCSENAYIFELGAELETALPPRVPAPG